MAHSLITLIPLLIQIEENFSRLYSNIAHIDGQYNPKLKTVAMVLSRQEKVHASNYSHLTHIYKAEDMIISQEIYEEIREVLIDFKKTIQREDFQNLTELLTFAIECEKKTGEILQNIGELDLPEKLKSFVDDLIKAEYNHAKSLQQFLPKD